MTVQHDELPMDPSDDHSAAGSQPREASHEATDLNEVFSEVALVRIAQAIRELRKVRREQFGLALAEPAWDMMIELYFQDSTGASTTASQLKEVSNVPSSTADRWLRMLEQEGWIAVRAHPRNDEARFVDLTQKARGAMDRYLLEVRAIALKQPTR